MSVRKIVYEVEINLTGHGSLLKCKILGFVARMLRVKIDFETSVREV